MLDGTPPCPLCQAAGARPLFQVGEPFGLASGVARGLIFTSPRGGAIEVYATWGGAP